MEAQIPMLRSLRSPDGAEPRAGLYARVIERIESQRPLSIWTAFLEPAFGPRLAIASAVLAIIMGIFLVSGEPTAPAPMPIAPDSVASAVAEREDAAPAFTGAAADDQQVRNAVFVSLATYRD